MKIRRFNENTENNLSTIKQYFAGIIDDYSEYTNIGFEEVNPSYFNVNILIYTIKSDNESVSKIDQWIDLNKKESIILQELKTAILRLENDNNTESIDITKSYNGFKIKIHTTIGDNIEDFIYLTDNDEIYYDIHVLKSVFKKKFGVIVTNCEMEENFDRHDERYLSMSIEFKKYLHQSKLKEISKYILNIQKPLSYDNDPINLFIDSWTGHQKNEPSNYISFVINDAIVDIKS